MSPRTPLRVLVVEDRPSDAELVLTELRRSEFDPVGTVVMTEAEYRQHLTAELDVVLSDYSLPAFDANRALEILRESGLDVPFVVVSGVLGEEQAVDMIKKGATDYLLKDRLERLGSAVAAALAARRLRDEKRRAEARRHEIEERYRALVESSPLPIAVHADGRFVYANPAAVSLLGATGPDAILGRGVMEFVHPESFAVVERRIREVMEQQTPLPPVEEKLVRLDGRVIDAEVATSPISFGERRAYQVVARDVTEEKRLRLSLEESEERYRSLFDNVPVGLFRTTPDGRFLAVNPAWVEMLGYPDRETLLRTPLAELYEDVEARSELLSQLADRGVVRGFEARVRRYDGRVFPAVISSRALREPSGEIVLYEGSAHDVSARKRAEEGLREALARAEQSDRLKTAFLANMSHEIRTPLNVILGYNNLIAEELAAKDVHGLEEMLAGVESGSRRLIRTVHQILDISRIEVDAFPIEPETLELDPVLRELARDFEPLCRQKGHTLELCNEAVNPAVVFDRYCLEQALTNLVDNAVKFTERGRISLRLRRDDAGDLLLEVQDNGVGIDPAYVPNLFQPFSQEESGYTRHFEGPGLGLALTRRYLELNGATVSVESRKGAGSTFTVRFGSEVQAAQASDPRSELEEVRHTRPPAPVPGERPTVLVVEDDVATQAYMRDALRRHYEVVTSASAAEARARLSELGGKAQIILMDISLGGEQDGLDFTRDLRARGPWKGIPVIAVTAHALARDRRNALAAGCDAYLAKPFSYDELLAAMAALVGVRS